MYNIFGLVELGFKDWITTAECYKGIGPVRYWQRYYNINLIKSSNGEQNGKVHD